jgi:hypothetical protein
MRVPYESPCFSLHTFLMKFNYEISCFLNRPRFPYEISCCLAALFSFATFLLRFHVFCLVRFHEISLWDFMLFGRFTTSL